MQVEYSKLPKSRALLNIEVDADKVNKAIAKACKNISRKTSIPGFRKGKAPRRVLERALGKEVILEETQNILLFEAYPEAVKKLDITPIGEPDLDVKNFEEDAPMIFTAEFDTKPVIEVPEYKSINIEIEKDKFQIKDEYLDESLTILKKQMAETREVTDRGLQKGDYVDLSMQLSSPDQEEQAIETVPKRAFFNEENFSDALIKELDGLKLDETKEFEIIEKQITEDGKEADDKKVSYTVTVNAIIEFKLPELTDEFIEKNTKYKNLEDVKDEFSKEWERILADKKKNYLKETVIDKLLEEVEKAGEFELPETLITSKVNSLMGTHMMQLSKSHLSLDDYIKQTGMEKDEYINKLREEALYMIKSDLILECIGKQEKIQLSSDELGDVKDKVKSLGNIPKNIKSSERKEIEEYMGIKVIKEKVLDFLVENVNIIEN